MEERTKKINALTDDLTDYFETAGFELTLELVEVTDGWVRYTLSTPTSSQVARMFKIPNLIYDNFGIQASEIMDCSGQYTDWMLSIPFSL